MESELIADYNCVLGEGPLWHPDEQRLYWADIDTGRLFWYEPAAGRHEQCYAGEAVGGLTVQTDGALLLFMTRGAVRLWRSGQLETVIDCLPGEEAARFNDVMADPQGRVFCGTLEAGAEGGGRLYRLDRDGQATRLLDQVGCSNGMGFSLDGRTLYYTDSIPREIYTFDYDSDTGGIANRRLFARTAPEAGAPDGLTVDEEGCLWSARWGGGCVARYTPDGREVLRVPLPALRVSSVAFGGPDLADLYVTTAGGQDRGQFGPGAGALFRLRPGVRGRPEFRSRIGD